MEESKWKDSFFSYASCMMDENLKDNILGGQGEE